MSLVARYKELAGKGGGGGGGDVPFNISGYLTEIDTGKIDADYMNSRFDKYLKELNENKDQASLESLESTLNELHKSFSSLTQSDQKYARLFLNELQRGDAQLIAGHSFRDYINAYKDKAENAQINIVVNALGLDKTLLIGLMSDKVDEKNLNNFGRFDALKESVDKAKAKAYFEARENASISEFGTNIKIDKLLKEFIIKGGFDLLQHQ